jgi:hypothetical protein
VIWIIASTPFWLAGVISAALALSGLCANNATAEDVWVQFKGFLILMTIAGVALGIAAKMVS